MRYRRGKNPRSLANLRPVKPGQVLNPKGRNQVTREREAWEIACALVYAVQAEPEEERRLDLLRELARHALDAGIAGDPRVCIHIMRHLWPVSE